MSITAKLASSLGRRDEVPNIELAKEIASSGNKEAMEELFANLTHKSRDIRHDSIKVLYEAGGLNPALLAPYAKQLVLLLEDKDNRMQWGAMTALNSIVEEAPDVIYKALAGIIKVADEGSVITNDQCVNILIKLCQVKKYEASALSLLNERLLKSPVNQLPMYAENVLPVITAKNKETFIKTLRSRLGDIEKESKRKRVEKVLKKLEQS